MYVKGESFGQKKVHEMGTFSLQNGVQNGKGLDLRAE